MIEIKLKRTAKETMVLVRELRAHGLVQGKDFGFVVDYNLLVTEVTFHFYNEEYGSWFRLKWL